MIRIRFECTASISTDTTGEPGGCGSMTLATRKCFSLFCGATAVYFVWSSFFGLNAFDAARVIRIPRAEPDATEPYIFSTTRNRAWPLIIRSYASPTRAIG